MKQTFIEQLHANIDALVPILYLPMQDVDGLDDVIAELRDDQDIVEYHEGLGCVDFATKQVVAPMELATFLELVQDDGYDKPLLVVLKDVHEALHRPDVIARLKAIAYRNRCVEAFQATVFIVASRVQIPQELTETITLVDVPLPEMEEIVAHIQTFCKDLGIETTDDVVRSLALSCKGMDAAQIQQTLNRVYQCDGLLRQADNALILRQKQQVIKQSGQLELIETREQMEDIGGLDRLKEWLERKAALLQDWDRAHRFGVDVPKGILLAGMPGCGKSLAAKATATLFEEPLVRLDIGRLMGKYVGESEENLRRALRLAEAISPCVLWIDELEKAFAGIGRSDGSSDVTTRLFGQFLTWMQEKEDAVFIVATANDVTQLPPEFLRKGRFDELFFVDLPKEEERRKIFYIHLKKRRRYQKRLDIRKLAAETDGYNGADIESIVKKAIETCFLEHRETVTTEDLQKAKENITPISRTMGQKLTALKAMLEQMTFQPASGPRKYPPLARKRQTIQEKIQALEWKGI